MKKRSSIMFDESPTENSENAITSGGVFKAIQSGGGGGSVYDDTELRNRIGELETNVGGLGGDITANSEKIGNLASLSTSVKSDLVSAINEVASGSGGSGGSGGIKKQTLANATRSVNNGRIQIDLSKTNIVGKTIISVVLKQGGAVSGQYKVIGACMVDEFLDLNVINSNGSDASAMLRMNSSTFSCSFDVYYI